MYKDVYIGLAHDKAFDFDKEGNWNGYMPTLLYGKNVPYEYLEGGNVIYWDLVDNPLCKQLDWGSWGLKRTAKDMVLFLEQYKGFRILHCSAERSPASSKFRLWV